MALGLPHYLAFVFPIERALKAKVHHVLPGKARALDPKSPGCSSFIQTRDMFQKNDMSITKQKRVARQYDIYIYIEYVICIYIYIIILICIYI